MNIKKLLIGGSLLVGGLLSSATVFAGGSDGECSVDIVRAGASRFYVPSGGDGQYNILGWGNGTGGSATTYSGLLESTASQCVLVAAATTANSGDGRDVQNAIAEARQRFGNILRSNLRICTSGHSQGGGGAFNAANRVSAVDCIVALQPDTVVTVQIQRPVGNNVDVVCIFSTADVLAPAAPSNANNCRRNSNNPDIVITSGTHFTPTSGDGGAPGDAFREAVIDFLVP